ncbi:MAG TPA: glycoside hydrolase family 97 N-terminal domain-containing protein, partial [Chitinophagaceae bacterium]|nr:glycoside hydrolase family 97 N-terminal domain-containing protein [Chitinophagaceae bacterium]
MMRSTRSVALRKYTAVIIACVLAFPGLAQPANKYRIAKESISLECWLDGDGTPQYAVWFKQQPVIKTSSLGFSLENDSLFYKNFMVTRTSQRTADETWQPVLGEVKNIRNNYEELRIELRHSSGKLLTIVFRVFADGVGFRYEFPKQKNLKYFIVKDEYTQFNLSGDHTAWWIPGDYDSNEYSYTTSELSKI